MLAAAVDRAGADLVVQAMPTAAAATPPPGAGASAQCGRAAIGRSYEVFRFDSDDGLV